MSKSLRIVNGDLAIGDGRSYDIVEGKDKLIQDLALLILERLGIDPATPTYGSLLDGGVIDGREVPSFAGGVSYSTVLLDIRNELISVLDRYRQLQAYNLRADAIRYGGRHTFDPNELIDSVDEVDVRRIGTTVVARVKLTTAGQQQLALTLPVTGT